MIRKAEIKDINVLMAIENACFAKPYSYESFLSDMQGDKVTIFVEEQNAEIVGFVSLYVFLDEANLQQIAVLPSYRRNGYAENLINYSKQYLKERNVKKFYLEVNETNNIAIKVYEKTGFQKVITRKNYYGNDSAIVYEVLL